MADRVGRRRALLMFVALASAGYIVYLLSPSWPFVFLGLALAMAWQSMASPAIIVIHKSIEIYSAGLFDRIAVDPPSVL